MAVRDDGFTPEAIGGPDLAILRLEPVGDLDTSSPERSSRDRTARLLADPATAAAMTLQSTGRSLLAGSVNDGTSTRHTFTLARADPIPGERGESAFRPRGTTLRRPRTDVVAPAASLSTPAASHEVSAQLKSS